MKKLVSLILALALCLGLGGTALAKGSAEIPRPDAYLDDDCVFYDAEMVKPDSGAEKFHHIQAAVEIDDVDELEDYLYFLDEGPFDLTLIYSEGIGDPSYENKAAFYEYTGEDDPGTIQAGDGLALDLDAPVQAAIFMEEDDGMAVLVLLCAKGFDLVKKWDDGEKSSGGFSIKSFFGLGGSDADPLPDPRAALSANKKSMEIEQMDDEIIDGVTYSVYNYSFTYAALSGDVAHSFYSGEVKEAGYTMEKADEGDDRIMYTIADGDGNTAVLVEYKKPTMSFNSWWTLYIPDGMEFDYGGDGTKTGVAGGTISGSSFQNDPFF